MMDKLSEVIKRFSITAGVFYSGQLCGISSFSDNQSKIGHVHLLRRGRLKLQEVKKEALIIDRPSLLFYPRPTSHRISADQNEDTEIVCASVNYGTGTANPLSAALPHLLVLPLAENPRVQQISQWLFDEAFTEQHARQIMMDRLAEILILQLLRHLLETEQTDGGMLAGLAHPQLCHALNAMHQQPDYAWTLDQLAELAGMSRSKFADVFRQVVGTTAGDYLIQFRVELAKQLLRKARPVGLVANAVGYETASALARVFRKKVGVSPLAWARKANQP